MTTDETNETDWTPSQPTADEPGPGGAPAVAGAVVAVLGAGYLLALSLAVWRGAQPAGVAAVLGWVAVALVVAGVVVVLVAVQRPLLAQAEPAATPPESSGPVTDAGGEAG